RRALGRPLPPRPRRVGAAGGRFFFQAEDGIRDYKVTGVQTCALPISYYDISKLKHAEEKIQKLAFFDQLTGLPNRVLLIDRVRRSEERRVGKECRARWTPKDERRHPKGARRTAHPGVAGVKQAPIRKT